MQMSTPRMILWIPLLLALIRGSLSSNGVWVKETRRRKVARCLKAQKIVTCKYYVRVLAQSVQHM